MGSVGALSHENSPRFLGWIFALPLIDQERSFPGIGTDRTPLFLFGLSFRTCLDKSSVHSAT